jgi:hypothetical protein
MLRLRSALAADLLDVAAAKGSQRRSLPLQFIGDGARLSKPHSNPREGYFV